MPCELACLLLSVQISMNSYEVLPIHSRFRETRPLTTSMVSWRRSLRKFRVPLTHGQVGIRVGGWACSSAMGNGFIGRGMYHDANVGSVRLKSYAFPFKF